MPCPHEKDNPGKHKEHTPITSEAQQGLMGADLARRRAGKKTKLPGMTTAELRSHLKESGGKDLPEKAKKHGSAPFGSFMEKRMKL